MRGLDVGRQIRASRQVNPRQTIIERGSVWRHFGTQGPLLVVDVLFARISRCRPLPTAAAICGMG